MHIRDNSGIVNQGTIGGDAIVQRINNDADRTDSEAMRQLREELRLITELIQQNSARVADPMDTLRSVERVQMEASEKKPKLAVLRGYLEAIAGAVGQIPPLLASVDKVRQLLFHLFGG